MKYMQALSTTKIILNIRIVFDFKFKYHLHIPRKIIENSLRRSQSTVIEVAMPQSRNRISVIKPTMENISQYLTKTGLR